MLQTLRKVFAKNFYTVHVLLEVARGGWPRLTFGHQGHLMNGSHVRNRGAQIEESGVFSLAV